MSSEALHLARLREWLREELAGLGVERKTRAALVLAVGELCANSIEHAYESRGGQPIHVSIQGLEDRLVLEVEDFGRAFEAARYVEPDLDALPDHGLGIHLVHRIADSVSVDVRREGGTRWTLVKFRPGHAPADRSIVDSGGGAPARSGEAMDIEVTRSAAITVVVFETMDVAVDVTTRSTPPMSFAIRDCTSPVRVRVKNASDSRWRCS